jgi:hypothetical protein
MKSNGNARHVKIHKHKIRNEESSKLKETLHIAIIGSGFSGLALANYLGQNEKCHNYKCHVIESRSAPVPIIGTFRLPNEIRNVFSEIGISIPNETKTPQGEIMISRQELLALLRKNISIQYSCPVKQVYYSENDKRYYLMTTSPDKNKTATVELGPFDVVVAAHGLSFGEKKDPSLFCSLSSRHEKCTAVIGDGRWYQTLWWDLFGFTRIKKGGAIAIMDGLELGRRLIDGKPLQEYSASWQIHRQRVRRVSLVGFRILLILSIFFVIVISSNDTRN